jgi:hypothetical protein
MMRGAIVFAAVLALAATGATAKTDGNKGQAAEAAKEKKICKTGKTTGSLTRRTRICMTEAQWRELSDQTRKGVGELQGSAAGSQEIKNNPGGF